MKGGKWIDKNLRVWSTISHPLHVEHKHKVKQNLHGNRLNGREISLQCALEEEELRVGRFLVQ